MKRLVPVYQYFNRSSSDHEYSRRANPFDGAWQNDGIAFYAFESKEEGTVPIYQYFRSGVSDHEYTTRSTPHSSCWKPDGIAFYAFADKKEGTVPIYGYFNGRACDHEYAQRSTPWDGGWDSHGIAFYAYPDNECLVYMKVVALNLMSKETEAGTMTFDEEVEEGYTHDAGINAKFHMSASAEAALSFEVLSTKATKEYGLEIGGFYNFSFKSSRKTKKSFEMPPGSRGYIYQAEVQCRTNKGTDLSWKGGLIMTDKPVDLIVEKHL